MRDFSEEFNDLIDTITVNGLNGHGFNCIYIYIIQKLHTKEQYELIVKQMTILHIPTFEINTCILLKCLDEPHAQGDLYGSHITVNPRVNLADKSSDPSDVFECLFS